MFRLHDASGLHAVSVSSKPWRSVMSDEPAKCDASSKSSLKVSQLKELIAEQRAVPVEFQRLAMKDSTTNVYRALDDESEVLAHVENSEFRLLIDLQGAGACIDICGFKIKCEEPECKFRTCCCYSGCDAKFNQCQWFCVHCICC